MARNMYGASSADFTLALSGRVVPGVTLTIWTARSGGTRVTDLKTVAEDLVSEGTATTTVTSDEFGSIAFFGPDNSKATLWADDDDGPRIAIRPVNLTGETGPATIGGLLTGKGDLAAGKGDGTALRQAAGADGTAVIWDSTQTAGLRGEPVGNRCTVNVATGTGALSATTGFFNRTGQTLVSSTDQAWEGARSLKLTSSITMTMQTCWGCTATLAAGGTNPADGIIPVEPGKTYTASCYVRTSANASPSMIQRVKWWTSAGNVAAATAQVDGTATRVSSDGWTRISVTATAPADAAFASVVAITSATVAGSVDIYIDGCDFDEGSLGPWGLPGRPKLKTVERSQAAWVQPWTPIGQWPAALTNCGSRPITVACVGDSITEGATAGTLGARWTVLLQKQLAAALSLPQGGNAYSYIPAAFGSGNAPSLTGVVSRTGGSTSTTFGLGRRSWTWTSAGSITFTVTGTDARIHYGRRAGSGTAGTGSWRYQVDGGAWTTVSTTDNAVSSDLVTSRFSLGASGSHTVTVEWVSGRMDISGLEVWDGNTATGVRVIDAGHGGWPAADFSTANAAIGGGQRPEALVGADLILIELGANDWQTTTPAQLLGHLDTIVAQLRDPVRGCPNAALVFVAIWEWEAILASPGTWETHVAAMRQAAAKSGAGLIDLRDYMPAWSVGTWYADNIHPTAAGHARMADIFTDYLLNAAAGVPAVSETLRLP